MKKRTDAPKKRRAKERTLVNCNNTSDKEQNAKKEITAMASNTKSSAGKGLAATKSKKQTSATKDTNDGIFRILIATTEAAPFTQVGDLGTSISSFAKALNDCPNVEARVILPLYDKINPFRDELEFVTNQIVKLSWRNQYCGLYRAVKDGVVYYFVDNEYYFKRSRVYGYFDDGERFAFFSRAVMELMPLLDFCPDVVHSNDHLTALIPIYHKVEFTDGIYKNIKDVFSIHDLSQQGLYGEITLHDVFGIDDKYISLFSQNGLLNAMKAALLTSDAITTVSPEYAKEILLPENSYGLYETISACRDKIVGILNGVTTNGPETSKSVFATYNAETVTEGKAKNKSELQRMLSLPDNPQVPLVAILSALTKDKGLDLVRRAINDESIDNVLGTGIQLVIMGRGDADIESYFTHLQTLYEGRIRAVITDNRDVGAKILAGADMVLMPSRVEPCGAVQMTACRYGAVPVARSTGGIVDTIYDFAKDNERGNGFLFDDYDTDAMDKALTTACNLFYYRKDEWAKVVKNAMTSDFSWDTSAMNYVELYKKLCNKK